MNVDYWTELANKMSYFDINDGDYRTKQKCLCNWDSWECILMKIIKGKWIFIMLFWLMLTPQHGWYMNGLWALYSDYSMVCFFCKVFLKSDTAVALRRSSYEATPLLPGQCVWDHCHAERLVVVVWWFVCIITEEVILNFWFLFLFCFLFFLVKKHNTVWAYFWS